MAEALLSNRESAPSAQQVADALLGALAAKATDLHHALGLIDGAPDRQHLTGCFRLAREVRDLAAELAVLRPH